MATARGFRKRAFHCGLYEAQDVLCDGGDVDLITLEPSTGFGVRDIWQRRLIHRDVTNRLVFMNPGLKAVRLDREYDLFIALCQTYEDLLYVNAIENWKDSCNTSVCWIDEIWASSLGAYRHWLRLFERFDHLFIACQGTIPALSKATGRQWRWLPTGIDTLRFTPLPLQAARTIDVYSIGRRWDSVHTALLEEASRKTLFYLYDTVRASDSNVFDIKQHRDLFASIAQRSRCFMVSPSKFDSPDETQGQIEIGYRYYEGAAAGTVMIGRAPQSAAFRETFGWQDVVIEIQPDGSDVVDVVHSLKSDPGRADAIGRRNAVEALVRHDWVYRWTTILGAVNLAPSAVLTRRLQHLKALAQSVTENDHPAEQALAASSSTVAAGRFPAPLRSAQNSAPAITADETQGARH